MLTVNFVDTSHLLVTFHSRRLLKRLEDCPQDDEDRSVDALLVELPSGKVLASTVWRTHDRGQYLWSLGKGRFMLRIRNTLTTFAPLENLRAGNAFVQRPFITTDRRISVILLSPESDLLVVESRPPRPKVVLPEDDQDGAQHQRQREPVQIDFFRIAIPDGSGDGVIARQAGEAFAPMPGTIPANSAGYVAALDQGNSHWAFDFRMFSGKVKELSPFESTCEPTAHLVSRSEFVAFGCHLGSVPQVIGGFNLRGDEMWEQNLGDNYISPSFVYAPAGGRFAMGRLISRSSMQLEQFTPELLGPQTVVVYQTDSGKQVMHIDCSPAERAGENFDLSPDGMELAVIRNDAVEIYNLPPLTGPEQKAVQLATASAAEDTGATIRLGAASGGSASAPSEKETLTASGTPVEQANGPVAPPVAEKPADAQSATKPTDDQTQTTQPRKPPTLYNEPGEAGAPSGNSSGQSSGRTSDPQ